MNSPEKLQHSKPSSLKRPDRWQKGRNRKEKSELVRSNLLWAATQVVGEVGYASASVARITRIANVGQGTFYNYFSSRQEILDELLPTLGRNMLSYIRKRSIGGRNFAELEERSFRAFFEFVDQEPYFFRILHEAESFAPKAHQFHLKMVANQYTNFLRRSLRNNEFPAFEEKELETIAYTLMATRTYLVKQYLEERHERNDLLEQMVDTYMKFVRFGLEGQP